MCPQISSQVLIAYTYHVIITEAMNRRQVGLQFWLFGHLVITGLLCSTEPRTNNTFCLQGFLASVIKERKSISWSVEVHDGRREEHTKPLRLKTIFPSQRCVTPIHHFPHCPQISTPTSIKNETYKPQDPWYQDNHLKQVLVVVTVA